MDGSCPQLCIDDQRVLLDIAAASIRHRLARRSRLTLDPAAYTDSLRQPAASFVTLHVHNGLRGCIGGLEAVRPLVLDVCRHADAAAFEDPRFPPLSDAELAGLSIHIAVLGQPQPMTFTDELDLIRQLRPGIDGLILEDNSRRSTFLPAVWEHMPDPRAFLAHLKHKAGLPADYWSPSLQISRYTVQSFPAHATPTS